ncbi:MAG: right-handed parallel beta-helix repeat-containing protein [Lentisphaeria bacterium]|nr:right-handed parallel beta-helix repeat-containing protein [Lentisphaeria bacterium]
MHGATISVAFRDITGTAIAMANSTGNRFSFPGIDASGDAPAGRASEPLISLTDCKGNEFTGVTELALANGTGAALAIVGGSRNTFPILNITSCEKGVVLENAIDHTLTLSVTECFGDAVTLKGAQRCTVNPKFILDNVGDGIVLENTVDTVVSGGDIAGNDGDAIRITGNSWGNHVKGCRIGVHEAVDNIADDIPNGNVGDGIVLSNGARENVIENVQIGLCGGNGVSMRGQGTDSNVLKTVDIGYFYYDGKTDYDDVGNGGIGVLIEQGAKHNRVESTDICHNAEGGIIIRDAGTDHTFVGGGTRIGALIYNYEDGYRWVAINQKWGVRVTGGAAWTRFDDCIIGTHPEGGVYVSDLPMYKDGENWPVSLEKIRVAYAMWSHSPVVDSMDSEYQSTGVALQFEGVEQARLSDIKTRRHTGGVRIAGAAAPKEWEFQGVYLGSSTGDGLYAEKLTDVSFDGTYASSHRGAGMRFIDGANLTIATTNKALTFNSNWDAAISLESCHDILLKSDRGNTLKLSRTQDGNSLRILNCQNVQVHAVELPSSYRSNNTDVDKGNAVWVENSSNIELLGLAVAGHRGRGVYIKGSTDVTLGELGDIPSLFTTNSTVSGAVCVEDSTNVLIGGQSEEPACVFKQTYCSGPVIEVRASGGARTSRDASGTTISSCLFQYRFYAGAIVLVDGASNVTVGDPVQSYANLFEGGDPDDPDSNGPRDRPGVEVRGSGTNIRILNNRFERMYAAGSYGFRHGVLLSGTDGVVVSGNFVEHTYRSGILLEAGAKNSLIVSNRIENSQDHGILVEGATTTGNVLSQNICSGSTYNPIRLQSGGNEEIDAPVITKYENHGATIQGMLFSDPPAGTRVEVYGGFDDEAAVLVGHAPVIDGQFSLSGYVPKDMEVRALCIHPTGNTSQLGAAQPNGAPPSFLYANTSGDNKDIWLMSQAKGGPVRLTHHVADDGEPVPMARNSGVVFVSDRAGNKDIWHVPFSDGTPVALTTDGADDYSPHCNPYQEQVAFVSERDGGVPHIFIWDSDRRGITQLTSGPGRDAEPAWATYGDSIAFASDRDGSWDIWVINGDGTNLRKWHTNAANERQPTWTSNGQLVFSSDRDGDEELYLSAGVNASQMTSNDAVDSSPSASDTGMTIFVSDRNGDRAAIFWHRNATSARQLVASSVELAAPAIVEHRFVTSCTDQFLETWRQNEEETLRSAASDDVSRDSHGFAEINVDEVAGIADAGVSLPMGLAGDTVPAALLLTLAYDPTTLGLTGEPTGDYRNSDAVFAWLPKAYPDNAGTIQLAWIARQGGSYAGPSFCQLPFMIAKSTTDTFSTVRITRSTAYAADGSALHLDTSDGIVRITPLRLDPPDLDPSSDSGHSSTDNETYLTTLKFIGTAIPGATATLVGDGLDLKSGQADGAGQWAITVTMTAGTHYMQARQSLADGTGGSLSSSLRVIVKISAALVDINTMAENGNANALRVEILADAGAIDVLEENLPVYRRFVEAAGSVPSLQRLQSFIDSANQGGEPVLVTVHNGWNAVASLDDGWVPAETFSAEELGPLVWEWDRDERSYIAYDADQPVPSQNARWLFLQQLPENGRQALLVGIPVEPLAAPSSEIGWNMECAAETKTVSQLSSSRGTVADVWQWNVSEQAYKSLGTEDEVVAGSVYWFYVR